MAKEVLINIQLTIQVCFCVGLRVRLFEFHERRSEGFLSPGIHDVAQQYDAIRLQHPERLLNDLSEVNWSGKELDRTRNNYQVKRFGLHRTDLGSETCHQTYLRESLFKGILKISLLCHCRRIETQIPAHFRSDFKHDQPGAASYFENLLVRPNERV